MDAMDEQASEIDREIGILGQFIELFDHGAEPRAREELSEEQREQLSRLAEGVLEEEQRAALVPLLSQNEVAMEFLAEEVRKQADAND